MGKREIIVTALAALAGLGGASVIAGATVASPYAALMLYGGWAAVIVSALGIVAMLISSRRKEIPPAVAVTGDNAIGLVMGSDNQIGHIGHVINQAPEPEIKFSDARMEIGEGGFITYTATLHIVAPYPPASLWLKESAQEVSEFSVMANRTGMVMTGHSGTAPGYHFTTLISPHGTYAYRVVSRGRTTLEYCFS